MFDLADREWEIRGLPLGRSRDTWVESVDIGEVEVRDHDEDNPVGNTRLFGRNHLSGPTLTFSFWASGAGESGALSALAALRRAWAAPQAPGELVVLKYRVGGRTRRVYGQPRKFKPEPNVTLQSGHVRAQGEFVTKDPFFYDDDLSTSGRLTLIHSSTGGVRLPQRLPYRSIPSGERQGIVRLGGDAPSTTELTVHGPVSDPVVTLGGHAFRFTGTLLWDQSVTLDGRSMEISYHGGANLYLSRKSYLSNLTLPPGESEIVYEGKDQSGTSWAEATWRDAHQSF